MRESELLAHIEGLTGAMQHGFPRVLIGPGDDCAMVAIGAQRVRMLLTTDQLVEGRHFTPGTSVDLIARKAVARSISDLAAMASRPVCGLATGLLPRGYPHARDLTNRLHHWGTHWQCPIVGGDIATGGDGTPLALTVTAVGELAPGEPAITRSGAKPGDRVYVTGLLGNSFASGRHLTFEPRIEEAAWLRATLGNELHAMIDISDGLGRDAARLARASGLGITLDATLLPVQPDASGWMPALSDGEDYELCFTTPRDLPSGTHTPTGVPVTCIGVVEQSPDHPAICLLRVPDGGLIDASQMGWDHS